MRARSRFLCLLSCLLVCSGRSWAIDHRGEGRKTTSRDLAVDTVRFTLPNGLVVLLAPDQSVSSVLVWTTCRAGTIYEPPGRSGMAHLVEHIMASGPNPETDYVGMLERRGSRYFNASTTSEILQFETEAAAEELPLVLWTMADRLGSVPPLIDDAVVERNRRIVLQERAINLVDAPHGLSRERVYGQLFPKPHPLHAETIGTADELRRVTAADVRAFVERLLVPANAILTVVGRFDPALARKLIEDSLGRLPPGSRAALPMLAPFVGGTVATASERISRAPGVTMAWRFPLGHAEAAALQIGAQVFSLVHDGDWGMRLSAALQENQLESFFFFELLVPYDEPTSAVHADAEGFLRMLTRRQIPLDLMVAANVALDRATLFDLDTLAGRAERLSRLERLVGAGASVGRDSAAHWLLDPAEVRVVAEGLLGLPHVVVHERPTKPRQARVGHDL